MLLTNTEDAFTFMYMTYKDDAVMPAVFVVPSCILATISMFGICLNSSIIYVTIRSRMRGTCHFLLALVSLFEVLHQLSHFVYFYVVIFGPHFIDYVLCVKIQTLSNFGSNALQATLFATAVDRLLSSMAPIFYKTANEDTRKKTIIITLISTPIILYGIYSVYFFLLHAPNYIGLKVTCDIGDQFIAEMYNYYIWNTLAIDAVTAICYAFVWVFIKKNVQATNVHDKLLKSLLAIVFINVGGYLFNLALMVMEIKFLPWPYNWIAVEFNAIILNIAAAANAPVLYWMSTEYRRAYRSHIMIWMEQTTFTSTSMHPSIRNNNIGYPIRSNSIPNNRFMRRTKVIPITAIVSKKI